MTAETPCLRIFSQARIYSYTKEPNGRSRLILRNSNIFQNRGSLHTTYPSPTAVYHGFKHCELRSQTSCKLETNTQRFGRTLQVQHLVRAQLITMIPMDLNIPILPSILIAAAGTLLVSQFTQFHSRFLFRDLILRILCRYTTGCSSLSAMKSSTCGRHHGTSARLVPLD